MPKIIEDWEDHGYTKEEWLKLDRNQRSRIRHPEKHKAAVRSWYSRNKEHVKSSQRKYQLQKYSLTEQAYSEMLEAQQGACAICGTTEPTGKWKVFAVDHCHDTGEVRGLLCNECNRGMGLLGDDPDRLRQAADYLVKHKEKTKQEKAIRNETRRKD